MEESLLLADLSNVSQDESQQINTQTRAAVYWAANKEVTSQQVKELYHIAPSPPPQQNPHPSPPSSSPAGSKPSDKGPCDTDRAGVDVDSARTTSCRKRNPAPRPISLPLPPSEPREPTHKRTMIDDTGDYWYRTSADVLRALGPLASSTPPRSQSRSQSQSEKRSQPKPPIQSPPASPPRVPGTGLVHQFSQLSTSETSQERATVLVPGSSEESNQSGTTQIMNYSERPTQADQSTSQPKLIPSNELFFQRSLTPPFNAHQRPRSPGSSPSLGGRRSSPSLGGSPRRMFTYMNRGGGSSPPASSAMPTQDPDLNSQTMSMDIGPDETGEGGSLDIQGTAPTQLDPLQAKYISATPASAGHPPENTQSQEIPPTQLDGSGSGNSSGTQPTQIGTQPTQIVTPQTQFDSQPSDNTKIHNAETNEISRTSPPPITPLRAGESSPAGAALDNSAAIHSVSPRRALTTPLGHSTSNLYRLDRSRKSSFAPPVRNRPDAQRPLPPLNTGSMPIRSTQTRWDAQRAEEEERLARATAVQPPLRTPSPRRRKAPPTATGIGTQDALTEPTAFMSGRAGAETPRLGRPPFSPTKMAVDDPEEDEDGPLTEPESDNPDSPKTIVSIPRRESSLPLEVGRKARQETRERENEIQEQSEDEHESEVEATPQRTTKPSRGVVTARRGRGGRGRGRGIGMTTTPRTPHEAQSESKSPVRTTSTGKKRARADLPREKSPAPAKKPKIQSASGSVTPVVPSLVGTRVLAWWSGGNYFFGSIVAPEIKGRCAIDFDDGTSSKVPLTRIRRAALRVGDELQVTDEGGSVSDATVIGTSNWETKRKVRVSIIEDGKEVRKEVDGRAISISTKIVGKSWGDRMFSEDPPAPSTKRKGAVVQGGTIARSGLKLARYAFVLTLKAEDVGVSEKELEGWKAKLRAKIEGQGGVVVDEWEELFTVRGKADANGWYAQDLALKYVGGASWPDVHKIFLLSGRVGTTPKYLMALALGVPCLSYKWVDEFLRDDTSQWMDALLPRGTSNFYQTEISQVVDPQLQSATDMVKALLESNVTRKPFKGSSVLCIFKRVKKIQPEGIDKGKFYSRVASVMGASSVHLVPDNDLNSLTLPQPILEYDYVVCENAATLQTVKSTIGAAGRSTDWVKQCIIMGRVVPSFKSEH